MKKWMILAAAILVVLGIGFAVKGASDRKLTVRPSETALPEATAEPEQAALTDWTIRSTTVRFSKVNWRSDSMPKYSTTAS